MIELCVRNKIGMGVAHIGENFGFAIEHKVNDCQRSGSSHNVICCLRQL
jgi:hypothetical protein